MKNIQDHVIRIAAVLLAAIMLFGVIPAVGAATAPAATSARSFDTTIKVGSATYVANIGDTFSYTLWLRSDKPLSTGQFELPVDFSILSGGSEADLNDNITAVMPVIGSNGMVSRFDTPSTSGLKGYVLNFVTEGSYDFSDYRIGFTLDFKVLKKGSVTMAPVLREFTDKDGNDLIDTDAGIVGGNIASAVLIGLEKKNDYDLAAPRISSMTNTATGLRLEWKAVKGAGQYRVFRMKEGSYEILDTVDAVNYLDKNVVSGVDYTYTIRAMDADAKKYLSAYIVAGWTQTYIAEPVVKTFESLENGLKLSWDPIAGAVRYRVFRKKDGSWSALGYTNEASFVDTTAVAGKKYTYTVRCVNTDGAYVSSYNNDGFSAYFLGTPAISSLTNSFGCVIVKWNAMGGAAKYRLFRKSSDVDTNWYKIADTTATSFSDPVVDAGVTYSYTVRCISADGKQYTSPHVIAQKSIRYIAAPRITKLDNAAKAVTVKWGKSTGAAKYRVFRKTGSGKWTTLTDTAAVTYTDKSVKSGTTYRYTIRCISADGKKYASGYDPDGKAKKFIAAPVLKSVANKVGYVSISWNKSAGAAKYRVFRKLGAGSWTRLGDTTGLIFNDKKAVSGKKYSYTVRCISADGKSFTSAPATGKTITYIAAPTVRSVAKVSGGVRITWAKVTAAAKYRVMRKVGSGKWTKLADTKALTLTDKKVKKNTKYAYSVCCISENGKTLTSAYSAAKAIAYR